MISLKYKDELIQPGFTSIWDKELIRSWVIQRKSSVVKWRNVKEGRFSWGREEEVLHTAQYMLYTLIFQGKKQSWAVEFFRNNLVSCLHSYSHANEAQASTKMYIKNIISFQNAEFALTIYRDKFSNLLLQQFLPTFPLAMKRHSFLQNGKRKSIFAGWGLW